MGGTENRPLPPEPKACLRSTLTAFSRKVYKYRHYQKALNAVKAAGCLTHFCSEAVHGSHHVLHGAHMATVTVIRPHGSHEEHSRSRFLRCLYGFEQKRG